MEWWHAVSEHYGLATALASVLLFAGMMGCLKLGGSLAPAISRRVPVNAQGSGIIEGAVLALLGLLVAFTFSGAAGRIGERNRVAIDEANAISTLYQRFDLLPVRDADSLRALLVEYSLSRMEEYRSIKVQSLHSAVLAGYRLAQDDTKSRLHRASFAAVMALTLFITLNMEYPRFGMLDMGNVDRPLKTFISGLGSAAR